MKNGRRILSATPFAFFLLAIAINLFLIKAHPFIEDDGVAYANAGIRFFKGLGFSGIYPPTYPLLIGLFNLLFNNVELSARLVSVFFGSLIMFPLFFMARWAFGNKVAIITGLLTLIYPNLAEYTPAALSESTFLFFFLLGLVLSWIALTRTKIYLYVLAGLTWGISFLTRPEGLGYLVLMVLILAFKLVKDKNKIYLVYMIVFFTSFFIAAFPYLLNQKQQTGRWSFGNKTCLNFVLGETVGGQQEWGDAVERCSLSLSDDGTKLSGEVTLEQDGGALAYVFSHPKELIRRYIINLHLMNKYVIPGLLYPWILLLFAAGLFSNSIAETKRASILFLACIPYLAFPLFIVAPRYFIYFVPIILIWSARGVVETARWIVTLCDRGSIKYLQFCKRQVVVEIILVGVVVCSFIPFTFRSFMQKDTRGSIYKTMGGWMKANLPENSKVIARKPWIPFYAEMESVGLPFEPWNRILYFARHRNVNYIIVDQLINSNRKDLKFLFEETFISDDAKKIREYVDDSGNKICLYQVMK